MTTINTLTHWAIATVYVFTGALISSFIILCLAAALIAVLAGQYQPGATFTLLGMLGTLPLIWWTKKIQ